MKKFFKILGIVVIIGIFGYTIYFLYEKSQTEPVVYETTSATVTNIIKKTTATGSVVPRKEIEIKPVVSGILDELYIEEGNMVKKGDLLAKIISPISAMLAMVVPALKLLASITW